MFVMIPSTVVLCSLKEYRSRLVSSSSLPWLQLSSCQSQSVRTASNKALKVRYPDAQVILVITKYSLYRYSFEENLFSTASRQLSSTDTVRRSTVRNLLYNSILCGFEFCKYQIAIKICVFI
jgi:hypothetical protein